MSYSPSYSPSTTIFTDVSKIYENFLKEFSRDFYQKIIDTNDFNIFEITLKEWIMGIDINAITILELMQNHQENEYLFSSIIGFFYQHGIDCDVNKSEALELYLSAVNNEKPSTKKRMTAGDQSHRKDKTLKPASLKKLNRVPDPKEIDVKKFVKNFVLRKKNLQAILVLV